MYCRRLDANAISSHDRSTLEAAVLDGRHGAAAGGAVAAGDGEGPAGAAAVSPSAAAGEVAAGLLSPLNLGPLGSPGPGGGGELRMPTLGSDGGGGTAPAGDGIGALPSDLQVRSDWHSLMASLETLCAC